MQRFAIKMMFGLLAIVALAACSEEEPPRLELISAKAGALELTGATSQVIPIDEPIVLTFSTTLGAETVNDDNIVLKRGSATVATTITPANGGVLIQGVAMAYDTDYTLSLSTGLRSDQGVPLSAPVSIQFRTEPNPAPPITLVSVKSGTQELTGTSNATNVSVALPIILSFSEEVDASTATTGAISLARGSTAVAATLVANGKIVTITPAAVLSYLTSYTLGVAATVKSEQGAVLGAATTITFTTAEPGYVYISQVIASPTDSETISLKNGSSSDKDISDWTLGDLNKPIAYKIPSGTILKPGETKVFPRTTLGFQINDTGETIFLKDAAGTEIDRWTN